MILNCKESYCFGSRADLRCDLIDAILKTVKRNLVVRLASGLGYAHIHRTFGISRSTYFVFGAIVE
jgi:hypothetical protein